MIIVDENKVRYDIEVSRNGENPQKCPRCSETRTKKYAKCFSFNVQEGIGFCHNCQTTFFKLKEKEFKVKTYIRPAWNNKTELSDKAVKWFEGRKISQDTLKSAKITEGLAWMPQFEKEVNTIQFNYFRGDELINIKYRTGDKQFKMAKDAEPIFYNLNGITDKIIITEGEMDALSYIEAGITYAISVPNGASLGRQNLEYFDNCIKYFENIDDVYIATDNDTAGTVLRNELVRRIGADRCLEIDFDDCKDANEYLIKYGKERLRQTVEDAKELPVDGIIEASEVKRDLDLLHQNGLQKGMMLGYPVLDELISWEVGRLCIITGTPGSGKSEFLDNILEILNLKYGMKFGIFSPENFPVQLHMSKLIEKVTGKKFGTDSILYEEGFSHISDNFYFINPTDENYSLDNILEKARSLVKRQGISGLVIDPWNRLEYQLPHGVSETNFISKEMTKIQNFAQKYKVLVFMVAHPRKINKGSDGKLEVPSLYDISGSAHFFNKTDYGIVVYRTWTEDVSRNTTDIYIQKVKFRHLGTNGVSKFRYNINNGRFSEIIEEIDTPDWDNSCHIGKVFTDNRIEFNDTVPF